MIHENLDELKTDLVECIAELSEAAVKEQGTFAIALSGGSLVGLMGRWLIPFLYLYWFVLYQNLVPFCFNYGENRELCHAPYTATIYWAMWHISWLDERVVAKNHPDSNYKLAKDNFCPRLLMLSSLMSWMLLEGSVV